MVREVNQDAHLKFARKCLENGEDFENVIFADESTIWLGQHSKICFRKEGRPGQAPVASTLLKFMSGPAYRNAVRRRY